MKNITVLGIDLAKDVFQLHGVNQHALESACSRHSRCATIFMKIGDHCIRSYRRVFSPPKWRTHDVVIEGSAIMSEELKYVHITGHCC